LDQVFVVCFRSIPLTPALSPKGSREREPIGGFSKSELGSVSHVGATLQSTTFSPLSLRERVRVRGFSKREFGSTVQVGVARRNNSVSPLSLRERVRVRGSLIRIFFLSRQAVTVRPTKPKPPGSDLT
jgi:hypothetical protein